MFKVYVLFVAIFVGVGGVYPVYPGWACRPNHYNATGTHSVFVGCVGYSDRLLYNQYFSKSGKWYGTSEMTVQYPPPGYVGQETITGVWLFDYGRNGTGGYARITNGGVGSKNVTVRITSPWFKGFSYLIQIYGRL